jgi:hypothetical protein
MASFYLGQHSVFPEFRNNFDGCDHLLNLLRNVCSMFFTPEVQQHTC